MVISLKNEYDLIAMWMFLQRVPGVGPTRLKLLYDEAGSISNIISMILKKDKHGEKWKEDIKRAFENVDLTTYKRNIELTYKHGGKICTLDSPNYPRNLIKSKTAPAVLYYKGHIENISNNALALVGTVNPSELGIKRSQQFAYYCVKNNIQVISGIARGIDTTSHKAALAYGGKTFAVLGHGIDICYPPENKELYEEIIKEGAIISQFPTGERPTKWSFPRRNETMCTIALGTVIVEANEKCGSLIQANYSFNHERLVFLLHSNLEREEEWALDLVKKGAVPVRNFNDVTNQLNKVNEKDIHLKEKQLNIFESSSQRKPKLMLFDLDGVLYDSVPIMLESYFEVVKEINGTLTNDEISIIKKNINNAPSFVLRSVGINDYRGNDMYNKKHIQMLRKSMVFFPGIPHVLTKLKQQGYLIGIFTSQPTYKYKEIIANAPFKNLLDIEITHTILKMANGKNKPSPDGILLAMKKLGVIPQHCAYVGDDAKDIKAAQNARVKSIAAFWGTNNSEELKQSSPDYCIYDPKEILEFEF